MGFYSSGNYCVSSLTNNCQVIEKNGRSCQLGVLRHRELLRQEPLIAMGFRFRRSARLGPLRFNFSKGGLNSISVGGRGASFNIPMNRSDARPHHHGLAGHAPQLKRGACHGPTQWSPHQQRWIEQLLQVRG